MLFCVRFACYTRNVTTSCLSSGIIVLYTSLYIECIGNTYNKGFKTFCIIKETKAQAYLSIYKMQNNDINISVKVWSKSDNPMKSTDYVKFRVDPYLEFSLGSKMRTLPWIVRSQCTTPHWSCKNVSKIFV